MKSYLGASFFSLIISWLLATLFYAVGFAFSTRNSYDTAWIGIFTVCSLFFSFIFNGILVQPLRYLVEEISIKRTGFEFALIFSSLGVIVTCLLFGWFFWPNILTDYSGFSLLIGNSAVNGFAYGFIFHYVWKPNYHL